MSDNAQDHRRRSGRLRLGLLAALFLGPLMAAAWLYYSGGSLAPAGRTNSGALLEPIVNVGEALPTASLSALSGGETDGRWSLVYLNNGVCAEDCEAALYKMRQSRKMLGRDMTRLARLFLHGESAPDKVLLDTEHDGLVTIRNSGLEQILDRLRPADLAPGGLFLIDPLGNLVMYFPGELEPAEMVADIEHLLDLSRIG